MGIFKKGESSLLCRVTAPEVKIFLIFCYLLVFFGVLWTNITYELSKYDETVIQIGSYIQCSANGIHDGLDCQQYRNNFEGISIKPLIVMYLVIGAFLNFSNLPLIIEYRSMKKVILSTLGFGSSEGK